MSKAAEVPILETDAVACHFTSGQGFFGSKQVVRAVDEISLTVRQGETLAIVGESGCGKSTLARLMVQLRRPTSGRVFYDGQDISNLSERDLRHLRKDLQFVFQDPFSSLNPRMTVGAIIEEPMTVHTTFTRTERRRKVAELLRKVGLRAEFSNRYPHEFSGGQRQRIGIARALASGPKVIIADEPVSALDVSVQAQVINLLEDLKEEFNLTLVLIAHDLAVIRHMSDRIAVMYLGEIVERAETDALFDKPLHPYTQALLKAIPIPSPHSRTTEPGLVGDIPSPLAPPPGCRFHTRCPHATDQCNTEKPLLSDAGQGRFVACHHWKDIVAQTNSKTGEPPRTEIAAKRFALYRDWSENKKSAQLNSPPERPAPQRSTENA